MSSDDPSGPPALPLRYDCRARLGAGGGGEVWSARDRATGRLVAVKTLKQSQGSVEAEALVRETSILSGLEGLGFPRVLEMGRLRDGRLYLVRELVDGRSLEDVAQEDPRRALSLLPLVGDVLTVVHRAGFVHGDVKPANVIARPDGDLALVDLGLTVALGRGQERAIGLTPHYAAPEVRDGVSPSVASEVFSLGIMLEDLLSDGAGEKLERGRKQRLQELVERSTELDPAKRFPSVDEFSEALRGALSGDAAPRASSGIPWPITGLESAAAALFRELGELTAGSEFAVGGPPGGGLSTLLRRVAWQEALGGRRVVRLEEEALLTRWGGEELRELAAGDLAILDGPTDHLTEALSHARDRGVTIVVSRSPENADFVLPTLEDHQLIKLLRGALPGLQESLALSILSVVGRQPGALRRFVKEAAGQPIVSRKDVEDIQRGARIDEGEPHEVIERCLDRGHFQAASARIEELDLSQWRGMWLRARYEIGAGSADRAVEFSEKALPLVASDQDRQQLLPTLARAHLGLGQYGETLKCLEGCEQWDASACAEGLAYKGLALSFLGRSQEATVALSRGVEAARESGRGRLIALVAASLATAQWRAGLGGEAVASYQAAIEAARTVGDAGILASSQINLSGLMKERGDLAASIELLEGAVDSARRAGRASSEHQALLNLTNFDLYLGRLERARLRVAQVANPETLPPALAAQYHGLLAELHARDGALEDAIDQYRTCGAAWERMGRCTDAAEAYLEACLVASAASANHEPRSSRFVPSVQLLQDLLDQGERLLDGERSALLLLAQARTAAFGGKEVAAERFAEAALELSIERGKREWQWRACDLLAQLHGSAGKHTRALKMTAQAVEVLEEIGARLPQDFREVYWSEPRRRALREAASPERASRAPLSSQEVTATGPGYATLSGVDAVSRMTMTPLERRLARVLAINSDLAAEVHVERLGTKIIAHACELLAAERGYLLLGSDANELSIVASRGGQSESHQDFSRSIARDVLEHGRPLVSVDTGKDRRIQAFESVHLAAVSAVACVPILSPRGSAIGALYVETRTGARPSFGDEVPTLQAFADQAAIALENARLLEELQSKSVALEKKNAHLREARLRLKEALGKRTHRLREVRKELRQTKDQLASHASYGQMVGQSPQMRRIYSLIDRIRDTDVPVLITGESGTGKEVVARSIFEGSTRSRGRLLAINCGAVPESILESELFGHTRGAFTGADRDRRGLFREADGGVLFLDEVGEMPLKMQASLLRALQESRVRPVGGAAEIAVDTRVIFATNRDLQTAVAQGRFREDLLYRIQVVEIALPPLRERRDDIPLLCDHFLHRFAARFGQEKKTIDRRAMERLLDYSFPGNIRQLENVLLNAWVLSEGEVLSEGDLRLDPVRATSRPGQQPSVRGPEPNQPGAGSARRASGKRGTLSEHEQTERGRIVAALEETNWNRVKAAELLDMPRRTFYRRLKEYGIQ